jgi:hypothetical protein
MDIENYIESISIILSEDYTKEVLEDSKEIINAGMGIAGDISTAISILKTAKDLPSKLFWSKLKSFLSGASDIPAEKRQKYITKIGKRQNDKDIERIFNIINSISEKEKMPYLVNLYKHLLNEDIDRKQFFIMSNVLQDSIYEDLQYLKEHINDSESFQLDENTCRFVSLNIINRLNETTWEAVGNPSKIKYIYDDFAKSLCQYAFE